MTRAETMQHIGEMLSYAAVADIRQDPEGWARRLLRLGKLYVQNGTFGTKAERRDAMVSLKKKLFSRMTGLDPVANAHQMAHWLLEAEADDE